MSATDSATVAAPPVSSAKESVAELLRGRLMQRALKNLLDKVPGSRAALPHLAALETGLGLRGVAAIQRASPRGLAKIHAQLCVLPVDPSDGTMLDLLSVVQSALHEPGRERTHQLSPFDPESTVVIMDASHSEFMTAMGERGSRG